MDICEEEEEGGTLLHAATEKEFDAKPPVKKAKKSDKEGKHTTTTPTTTEKAKKKKICKSPNKSSSTKEKKSVKKLAKKKADDNEKEEFKMDIEYENLTPSVEKEDHSNDKFSENFDEEFSEKASNSKKAISKKGAKKNGKASAKEKKATDEEADAVLEYMKKQNRPYSLINIFDNLHGKIKKPQVQKILDSFVEAQELQMKEFGKAKIYLLNQKNIPDVNQVELDKISNEVQELRNTHRELAEKVKSLNSDLKSLQNQLTDEQLDVEIAKYEKFINDAESKLKVYESGNYPKISDQVMKKCEDEQQRYEKEYKKRKKICMQMINQVSEMSEQKVSVLFEELGFDMLSQ